MTRAKSTPPPDPKQEFRSLLKLSGWSQAEAARQLAMTPSALSQIVRDNSPVRPSPVTLRLFQLLLWREKQEGVRRIARPQKSRPGHKDWAQHLSQELGKLDPNIRDAVLAKLFGIVKTAQKSRGGVRPG